ncbi:MAG: sulfite exporter TauE/SafE family protein [Clostridiales bacterium]|jgi:uncharacterized membrane protein YfcA|nr:sulfite exporter TauE/SafE family protein [Clostridiales bacterium]
MNGIAKKIILLACGLVIGFINGFFGGGGGLITVPVLERVAGLKTKSAHATAILIILPITVASAVIYIIAGKFDFGYGLPAGLGVIAGGVLGAAALSKLSNKLIRVAFAAIMLAAGIKLLFF